MDVTAGCHSDRVRRPRLSAAALLWQRSGREVALCSHLLSGSCTARWLDDSDASILSACDGQRTVAEIAAETGLAAATVESALARWEAAAPGIFTREEPAPIAAARRWAERTLYQWRAAAEPASDNATHHRNDPYRPDERFECVETTVSHAFRETHPALRGRTFGQALHDVLASRGAFGRRVLEIGGGTGYLARAFLDRWRSVDARTYASSSYSMLELSSALRDAQKEACREHARVVEHWAGDIESFDFAQQRFDLVIANEMIADLSIGVASAQNVRRGQATNEAEELMLRYGLSVPGRLPRFAVNVGALRLVERLPSLLSPGGRALVTEHGSRDGAPQLLELRGHREYSVNFRHLAELARAVGLEAQVESLGDLLEADSLCEVVATDSLLSLNHAVLPLVGLPPLPRLAYDREKLAAALSKLWPSLRNVQFRRLAAGGFMSPFGFQAITVRRVS